MRKGNQKGNCEKKREKTFHKYKISKKRNQHVFIWQKCNSDKHAKFEVPKLTLLFLCRLSSTEIAREKGKHKFLLGKLKSGLLKRLKVRCDERKGSWRILSGMTVLGSGYWINKGVQRQFEEYLL